MKGTIIITGVLVVGLISAAHAADHTALYKWVDEKDVTHYSERVPYGVKAELIAIRREGASARVVTAPSSQRQSALSQAAQVRKGQEDEAAEQAEKKRQQAANQAAENCRIARERLTRYTEAYRLYRPLPNGERDYLTSEQIDAERAGAIESVNKWCGKS